MESFTQGTLAGGGTFRCESCGFAVALHERDLLPACPRCESTSFTRSSLFGEHGQAEPWRTPARQAPDWLGEARREIESPIEHLAWEEDGGGVRLLPLAAEWTRLGRSLSSDAVFDDPTVSRRHALIHRTVRGSRVLDDRSLNGVFVNGERVEESDIVDGDELAIGRFRLYFLAGPQAGEGVGEPRRTVSLAPASGLA
jgi:hypothetical protein